MALFRRRPSFVRGGSPNSVKVSSPANLSLTGSAEESLTAAGFKVQRRDAANLRRLIQPWQERAFAYYDRLGEIKYASQFYSRMLAPLRLYVAKKDPATGEWNEIEDPKSEPEATAALNRLRDPGGGLESLLSSYGRLIFLAGEGYLLCSIDRDSQLEQWEFLSTDELRIQEGVYMRFRAPSLNAEEYREADDDAWEPINDKTAVAYRLWRRHPRYSSLADSTMMGVLDLCEELLLLTLAVRARARSRLASSGILLVSEDIDYPPIEPSGDEDPEEDPFLHDLTEAMTTPLKNEGAPSAVVPLVVRVPEDVLKNSGGMKFIQVVDPTQLYPETGLRRECIERIAIGLDMPPEILLGMADANHWTVWMIDEQTWKAHGQPVANQLVNDLNSAYFLPQLRADNVADWENLRIEYDASAIVNHPDRTKDAKDLYDREAISKAALRDAAGFTEDDAMPDDELAERIGVKTRDSSLAWFGEPAPRGGAVEVAPGDVVSADGTSSGTEEAVGKTTGGDVEKGPPAGGEPPQPEDLVGSALLAAKIVGAADFAVLRAREAAGNRLRSLAKRDDEVSALIARVAARDIPATVGHDRTRAFATAAELVAPAGNLIRESLTMWGFRDKAKIDLIAERIESHAARTLFEERPTPLPPQFAAYVAGVLEGK